MQLKNDNMLQTCCKVLFWKPMFLYFYIFQTLYIILQTLLAFNWSLFLLQIWKTSNLIKGINGLFFWVEKKHFGKVKGVKRRGETKKWFIKLASEYGAGRQAEQEVCHFICPSTELHFFTSPLIWDCCKFWSSFGCNFTIKTLPPDRFGLIICG